MRTKRYTHERLASYWPNFLDDAVGAPTPTTPFVQRQPPTGNLIYALLTLPRTFNYDEHIQYEQHGYYTCLCRIYSRILPEF